MRKDFYKRMLSNHKISSLDEAIKRFDYAKNVNLDVCLLFNQLCEEDSYYPGTLDAVISESLVQQAKSVKWKGNIHRKQPADWNVSKFDLGRETKNSYYFMVKDDKGIPRYYHAWIDEDGTFFFREASAGYSVASSPERSGSSSFRMTKTGADKVLATIVAIIQRMITRSGITHMDFSSGDRSRTNIYRRLARLFAKGYFNTIEKNYSRGDLVLTHTGNIENTPAGGGTPLSTPWPVPDSSRVNVYSTDDPKIYRVTAFHPRRSEGAKFVDLPKSKVTKYLKKGGATFILTGKDSKEKDTPIVDLADIPPNDFVIYISYADHLDKIPLIIYPYDYDKATQLDALKTDAHRLVSMMSTYRRLKKKSDNKAVRHPGRRLKSVIKKNAGSLMKDLFKKGLSKPPVIKRVNPVAYHRLINQILKGNG